MRIGTQVVLLASLCSMELGYPAIAQPPAVPAPEKHLSLPKPENLKVLSKEMETGELIELMLRYSKELGVHCEFCHLENAETHRIAFADDSKAEKRTARIMITMTNQINSKYLTQLTDQDQQVTCGTCHRGHSHPETFDAPGGGQQPHSEPSTGTGPALTAIAKQI